MPYISRKKISKYVKDFNNNSGNSGFVLLVNLMNFNLLYLETEHKNLELARKNFLQIIKQIASGAKYRELSKSYYIIILPGYNTKQVTNIVSEINETMNLKISLQLIQLNCKMIFTAYENICDPKILLQQLIITSNSPKISCFMEYQNNNEDYLINRNISNLLLLRRAIVENKITFAHQPIISCINGNVEYFEYLMRIPDENGDYISVGPIIPHAEKTGLINIINKLVLKKAVNELQTSSINIAINISLAGISDPELIELINTSLYDSQISKRLIIEITETFFNNDFEQIKNFINVVHKVGAKIALDDFGSGWTSFIQLMDLPIDIIKLDGRYIRNLNICKNSRVLVECLVKIANTIGAKTVAEFVENKEIAQLLKELHVDGMQGNYFAPALLNK